jgi:hypothetical protein
VDWYRRNATSTKAMMVCSTEESDGEEQERIALLSGHKELIDGGIRNLNRSDARALISRVAKPGIRREALGEIIPSVLSLLNAHSGTERFNIRKQSQLFWVPCCNLP